MPKQYRRKTVAEIEALEYQLPTMAELRTIKLTNRPLKLVITIPGKVVPLFYALMMVSGIKDADQFAVWALCRGLVSEEAVQQFDDVLNSVTAQAGALVRTEAR